MRKTVCITGPTGGIGRALLERLVELYDVKALFRTKTPVSDEWERRGCKPVWGNLGDEDALSRLVAGTTFVFHCAAVVAGPYDESYAVNVEGTRRLARTAGRHGCGRFIHISSVAVYSGATTDGDYTENTPLGAHAEMAAYSVTKLLSEEALRDAAREHGLEFTILRPTCVYGPHVRSYTLVPIQLIRKGLPVIPGDGHGVLDAVYVDDVVSALLLAAESPRANGEAFIIGNETVTLNDFYAHYGLMLNRPVRHLPASVLGGALGMMRSLPPGLRVKSQWLRRGVGFLLQASENTKRYPSSKAAALLGYTPQYNLSTGMLKTELWAKHQGLVGKTQYSLPGYGPLRFRPLALAHPASEQEIACMVGIASDAHARAKAIGSLHSLCPIPETDGLCLVLDQYNKLLSVEGSLVTVQAGMKLRDLNDALARLGLALPINGSISEQTVSGAISTGTHGGSIHRGSLSDYVDAVRIVKADGTVVEIDRSDGRFPAVVVSVGVLGIVSTVTFRVVPSFVLQSRVEVRKAQDVFADFDAISRRSLYVDMLYFPSIDQVEVLSIDMAGNQTLAAGLEQHPRPAPTPGGVIRQISLLVVKSLATLLHHLGLAPLRKAIAARSVGRFYQCRVGRSDFVLALGELEGSGRSPMTMQDMEVAIPYEKAGEALDTLRRHFATTKNCPLLPVHIRISPSSAQWLSPAYDRDVCWMEFWQYPQSDAVFRRIHELMKPYGYRFHWGKETRADREYIRSQYPRWDDFVRLREEWDPRGVFLNGYLASFFCEEGSAGPTVPS